jgi:hypothetical protein
MNMWKNLRNYPKQSQVHLLKLKKEKIGKGSVFFEIIEYFR